MTECINTKPVTCSKGRKVPFAVMRHNYNAIFVFLRQLPGNHIIFQKSGDNFEIGYK